MPKLLHQGHGSYRFIANDERVIYVDPYAGKGYDIGALSSVSFSFAVTMLLGSLRSIIVNISEFKPLEVSYRRLQKIRFPGVA